MSVLDEICEECGASLGQHMIGPGGYHPRPILPGAELRRLARLRQEFLNPDAAFLLEQHDKILVQRDTLMAALKNIVDGIFYETSTARRWALDALAEID